MAIQTASGFTVGSSDPIDSRLVLSKEQMKTVNDNVFPEKYIAVCKDDGNIYIYQKSNEPDAELGKFRLFKSGGDSNFEEELKSFTQDKLDGNTGLPPSDIAIKNAMGEANGFATLDANGRIPSSMLPTSAREIVGYIDAGVDHNLPPEDGYESGNEIIITASGYILRSTSFSLPADSYINALEVNQANKLIGHGYVFTLFVDGSERGIVSGFSSNGVTLLSGDVIPIPNALELSVSSEPSTVQQEVKEGDSFMLIGGHWILLSSSSGVESVNGKTGAVVVKELPIPVSKDKLLLTTENAETTELEWSQVDKSEVGDVIHEYTLDEWKALSEDDKPPVGSKVIIKNDSEESMIDDESVSSSKVWSSRKVSDELVDINVKFDVDDLNTAYVPNKTITVRTNRNTKNLPPSLTGNFLVTSFAYIEGQQYRITQYCYDNSEYLSNAMHIRRGVSNTGESSITWSDWKEFATMDKVNEKASRSELTYNKLDGTPPITGWFAGVVASSATAIVFAVPLDRPILANSAELISGDITLRHTAGYAYIADASTSTGRFAVNNISVEKLKQYCDITVGFSNHILRVSIKLKTGKYMNSDGANLTTNWMAGSAMVNGVFEFS